MKYASKLFVILAAALFLAAVPATAQEPEQEQKDSIKIEFNEDAPILSSRETPKRYYIRKVNVSGVKNLNENLIACRIKACFMLCLVKYLPKHTSRFGIIVIESITAYRESRHIILREHYL